MLSNLVIATPPQRLVHKLFAYDAGCAFERSVEFMRAFPKPDEVVEETLMFDRERTPVETGRAVGVSYAKRRDVNRRRGVGLLCHGRHVSICFSAGNSFACYQLMDLCHLRLLSDLLSDR
jgi:hypothetical protein